MKRLLLVVTLLLILSGGAFAQDESVKAMGLFPAMDKLGNTIAGVLDTNQVLGKPIQVGEVTLIPVVAKGLGFGLGEGMSGQDESANRGDKGGAESSKDRHGIGCGAGGFVRPLSLIVVYKNGRVQIQSLQEGGLVGMAKALIPVFQQLVSQKLEMFKIRKEGELREPPPPPKK